MQYIIYAIYIYIMTGLNAGVFPAISLWGGIPQLMVLTCTVLAVTEDDMSLLLFVGLVGGFLWELFTGVFPGSLMLGYMLATGLVYILSRRVFFIHDRVKYLPVFLIIFHAFITVWLLIVSVLATRLGFIEIPVQFPVYFRLSIASFFYNLILLYPVYVLLAQVERIHAFFDRQRHTIK